MRAIRTTPPGFDPVSLADMKAHLRVAFDDDDAYITALSASAVALADVDEGRGFALAQQDWAFYFDAFPAAFRLPVWPAISVQAIEYLDEAGDWQAVNAANYRLAPGSYPSRVSLSAAGSWPASPGLTDGVRVTLRCGHASAGGSDPGANIPADMRHALKLIVGHWYRNREEATDRAMSEIPLGASAVLNKYAASRIA